MGLRCDNCGKTFGPDPEVSEVTPLHKVSHLTERLDPGSEVPYGECVDCGALVYLCPDPPPVQTSPITGHACWLGPGCDLWHRKDSVSITCGSYAAMGIKGL